MKNLFLGLLMLTASVSFAIPATKVVLLNGLTENVELGIQKNKTNSEITSKYPVYYNGTFIGNCPSCSIEFILDFLGW